MRRWLKWTAWSLGALLLLALVAILFVSWRAGQDLLHPERDLNSTTPDHVGLTWEALNLTTSDGVVLAGWWMPGGASDTNATVVFLHGYGDSKAQGLEVYPFLHNASYNVLAFDLRAHGFSGGDHTTAGIDEARDLDAALAYVKTRLHQEDPRVALLGWSMGGALALNTAATHPELDAVITDGAFSRLQRIVETSISKFTDLPRWPFGPLAVWFASQDAGVSLSDDEPYRAVASYHGPLLLIHGADDDTVTPDQVDAIAANAPQGQVWKVPGAHHLESHRVAAAAYEGRVLAFLDPLL